VEPSVIRLTDRIYPENEYVPAEYRILNTTDRPIKVTGLSTSCGCTTAILGGGKSLPLVIAPKASQSFSLKAFGIAKRESFQTFFVSISSECDGQSLPDVTASLQFRVEDTLKASPAKIVGAGLPLQPTKRRILLFTQSASTVVSKPEVRVSDPESIRTELNAAVPGSDDQGRGFTSHYTLDVVITPRPGEPTVVGVISVISGDRLLQTIPVECAFKLPFTLSLREINVSGRAGDRVGKEIYYEAHDPEWRDVYVSSKPSNVSASVDNFDVRTQRIRFTIDVPAANGMSLAADGGYVVLTSKNGNHEIRLPLRYELAGGSGAGRGS
jgi:hypothetical protein